VGAGPVEVVVDDTVETEDEEEEVLDFVEVDDGWLSVGELVVIGLAGDVELTLVLPGMH
jgi:hypothetical protein